MLLLGIDVGTSSIKVSVVDSATQECIASAQYPDIESEIIVKNVGWAEQDPEMWWEHVKMALLRLNKIGVYNPLDIVAIGIAYQMHGLVLVNNDQHVLRNSIIWCDSRAVEIGERAFDGIGHNKCFNHTLNSPSNFTAAKLAWVKENEPDIFKQIHQVMLPGDFIAMKLTGDITTSISALSEGVFWDFKENQLSKDVIEYYGFDKGIFPPIQEVFSSHGQLSKSIADSLSLKPGIPVTYKSGDQPNNALSLNVLKPGEVAATAGTSGVIYGVTDQLVYDADLRVNTFAHVNYTKEVNRLGVLLCINGTGILNRWVKNNFLSSEGYEGMNREAQKVAVGSEGLRVLPFGNGAERMLNNKIIGAHINNIDLNRHSQAHIFRAVQEGIAFSFRYGLDRMKEVGIKPNIIRAGKANLFMSDLFIDAFVNSTGVPVELYQTDGSIGAALGAGIGYKSFSSAEEAFTNIKPLKIVEPRAVTSYEEVYREWEGLLIRELN